MKFIIKIAVLAILIIAAISFIPSKTASQKNQEAPLFSIDNKDGHYSVSIREEEREEIKATVIKIRNLIYQEATIHNPSGDVVPDAIDDKVIQEVKEKVN